MYDNNKNKYDILIHMKILLFSINKQQHKQKYKYIKFYLKSDIYIKQ